MLIRNSAPHGDSFHLSRNSTLEYVLPALPGRWLSAREGVARVQPGAIEDLEFPYACPAGVLGGASVDEQSGPGCSGPW